MNRSRRGGPPLLAAMLSLLILLGSVLGQPAAAWAGSVDWHEVPATAEGRQWWDAGSLRRSRGGDLSVLSRFLPAADDDDRPRMGDLYVMEINCGQQLYRDTSVNGVPRFNATWSVAGDDSLVAAVIEESCRAGAGLLQAG